MVPTAVVSRPRNETKRSNTMIQAFFDFFQSIFTLFGGFGGQ